MQKDRLSGAFILATLLCLGAGGLARLVASTTPLGPVARMLDSLPVLMFGAAVLLGVGALMLGARRIGAALVVLTLVGWGTLIMDHRRLSLPPTPLATPDLRVVFYNTYDDNPLPIDRLIDGVKDFNPDVIVLAESSRVDPELTRLTGTFTLLTDCTLAPCELLIATRLDVRRHWLLALNPVFAPRYGVVELETDNGKTLFLSIAHLLKPWMSGVSEPEWERLIAQYNWLSGPVVAVGDFNTAPWSRPMRRLLEETGFKAMRNPPGTWPTRAGDWGLPIDQVLVRGGARVVAVTPFGEDLGSNHRGLVIDIALPEQP